MKRKEREDSEELPHDVVEEILKRILEVKSLVRLRCVSKQWNSTIKSTSFASRHLIQAQSRDPHVVFSFQENSNKRVSYLYSWDIKSPEYERFHILPKSNRNLYITGSCDGLVCVYDLQNYVYVINPATRWCRSDLPCAKIQEMNQTPLELGGNFYRPNPLGFGKDTITGKYKMVWLYNFLKQDLEDDRLITTCEVFDFDTNTWRYVMSSTHPIWDRPSYLDGSLYWLTLEEEKLIRFDLHTEVFHEMEQVLPLVDTYDDTIMCSVNNRLCLSVTKSNNMNQEIWLLNSDKVWEKTYTINSSIRCSLEIPLTPITVFNKTEILLLYEYISSPFLVIHDIRTCSSSLIQASAFEASSYFPSLIYI